MPRIRQTHIQNAVLVALAARELIAMRRDDRPHTVEATAPEPAVPAATRRRRGASPRRVALTFATTVLFFAGASFSALGGNEMARVLDDSAEPAATVADAGGADETAALPAQGETDTPDPAAAPVGSTPAPAAGHEQAVEPAPEASPSQPAPDAGPVDAAPSPAPETPAGEPAPGDEGGAPPAPSTPSTTRSVPAPVASAPAQARTARTPVASARRTPRQRLVLPPLRERGGERTQPALDPEVDNPLASATVWLARPLPDPTPPSVRLSPAVAQRLVAVSRRSGADWALVLAAVRAGGEPTVSYADTATRLAGQKLGPDSWTALLALHGDPTVADRAVVLAHYYRAVGLDALVRGLMATRTNLAHRLLRDPRVSMYAGGRADVAAGRIDVRVLALVAYLADRYGQVTVSSLVSGHRLYSRPGVVSAHVYGHAVDIAALAGRPIAGNQEPGGLTESAVRGILLLPAEVQPKQLISLLGLGGASFPLGDHHDHVHVGY